MLTLDQTRAALEQLRDQCADMAEGYSYGYAGGRAIRTMSVEPLLRALAAAPNAPGVPAPFAPSDAEHAPDGKKWLCVRCGLAHPWRQHTGECATPDCHSVNLKLVCGNCLDTGYRDEGGQQIPCDACGVTGTSKEQGNG